MFLQLLSFINYPFSTGNNVIGGQNIWIYITDSLLHVDFVHNVEVIGSTRNCIHICISKVTN